MLHSLERFRIGFGDRPLLLWLAVGGGIFLWRSWRTHQPSGGASSSTLIAAITTAALIAYPAVVTWYAANEYFFDNAEPTIPSVAWVFHGGRPLYHALTAPERYAHIYGPYAFLPHAWALALAGPAIRVSKAVGAFASLIALLAVGILARRRSDGVRAALIAGGVAAVFLSFRNYAFWTRPDPLLVLSVAVCLWFAALDRASIWTDLLAGAAAGFGWGLKFTGPLYTLVPLGLIALRRGRARTLPAVAIAIAVAAAPFVASTNISFTNYLAWIAASGRTGLLFATLRANMEWTLFLTAPLLLVSFTSRVFDPENDAEWRTLTALLLLGLAGVSVAAAKPGAGAYHLLPFAPVIAYLVACRATVFRLHPERRAPLAAWFAVALAIAFVQQVHFVRTVHDRAAIGDADEIARFADSHAGIVDMGYGATESLSRERPILVFRNNSYFLDQPAVREEELQGIRMPASTVEDLTRCRVDVWLIPRGESPFSGVNGYAAVALHPLYSDAFRSAFLQTHRLVESTAHFDAWRCVGAGK